MSVRLVLGQLRAHAGRYLGTLLAIAVAVAGVLFGVGSLAGAVGFAVAAFATWYRVTAPLPDIARLGGLPSEIEARINGIGTQWHDEDIAAASQAGPHGIVVPKVNTADEVRQLVAAMERAGAPEHTATIFVGGLKHLPIRYSLSG